MFGSAFAIIIKKLNMLGYLDIDTCQNLADMLVLCHQDEENLECFNMLKKAVSSNENFK